MKRTYLISFGTKYGMAFSLAVVKQYLKNYPDANVYAMSRKQYRSDSWDVPTFIALSERISVK